MTIMVPLVLWSWIPLCILLFALLPPRRAVLVVFLGGYLFFPFAGYKFVGLPDYTPITAVVYGTLLGILIFDPGRLMSFRFGWVDLPMIVWCICPFFASISNQIGGSLGSSLYGGLTISLDLTFTWAAAYFVGRMYITDFEAVRELAIAIFIGGLIYVPLCLIEIRFSPQLHQWVYGYRVGGEVGFVETLRLGGYRPTVFMQHGLAVGMYMTVASLTGVWLWVSGSLKRVAQVPMTVLVPVLLITTVLCKSTGALALLLLGLGCLFFTKWTRWRVAAIGLAALAPTYLFVRLAGWTGVEAINIAAALFGEDRTGSLAGRMANEDLFMAKAWLRPIFGWSAWDRFQVFDELGEKVTTPDGMWVLALGQFGLTGLISLVLIFLIPAWYLLKRYSPATWFTPTIGPAAALTISIVLYLIDCILNAMISPVFILAMGGLTTVLPQFRAQAAPRRPAAVPAPSAARAGAAGPSYPSQSHA